MAEIDPKEVGASLDDIRVAVADARIAIASFKGVSEDIDKRQPDIDKTITNISQTAEKINKASSRVDGVLVKVDSFLGTGDSQSLFAEARATLKSFKQMAETLNSRIGPDRGQSAEIHRFRPQEHPGAGRRYRHGRCKP